MALDDELMVHWRRAVDEGVALPPEVVLAERLGVSRPRVREELIRLETAGLVIRHPSKGTFPNALALEHPLRLDRGLEFADALRAAGHAAAVEVLEAGWGTVDAAEAAALRIPEGSSAYRTVKLWRADGRPVMVADDVVPASPRPGAEPVPADPIFATVELLRGRAVEWEGAQVEPVLPDPLVATRLGVDPAQPLLRLSIIGASRHGDRLYLAREHHDARALPYGILRAVRPTP